MAWMHNDIELGVGTLVMFSFVHIDLVIMASMPPLAYVTMFKQIVSMPQW